MLRCTRCGKNKDRSEFGTHVQTKQWCKVCRSEADRFRRFRLTPAAYDKLLAAQGGVCAICKNPEVRRSETGKLVDLSVDHDHNCCPGRDSCGKCVRGLLCERCNRTIGLFEEDTELLGSAINYIRRYTSDNSSDRSSRFGRAWHFFAQKRRLARQD